MADLLESIFSKSVDPIQDESIQELAVRYFNEICKIYLIQPDLILEHHEVETKTTLQYDGRQLLELIQNADDAAHHLEKPKMLIKLEGDQLIVANMGEPFSSGGLTSIFHSRLSPKFEEKNQIGNKGLGFRSILNWAEQVRIKSGELKIGFSERYSQSILSELILQEPKIELAIRKRFKKFIPAIAVLRVPQILTEVELSEEFDAYDTVIIIDLKPGMAKKIAEQLDTTVNAEMMLFLNHLYEVRIDTPDFSQIYGHDLLAELSLPYESCAKEVALTFLTDGKPDRSIWHLYGKKGIIGDKGFELAVAWQDEMTESSNLLHCFFRTEVTFKFPGLLHGTFELNDNRNELIRGDGYNGLLFEEAANLIAAAAGYAAALPAEKISYLPMRLGIVDSASLTKLIRESGFEAKLKEALVKQKVFPCTRQVYIDWLKLPGYYPEPEFAKHLPSQRFTSLLINPEQDADIKFIEALRPGKYDLKTVISALAEKRKTIPVTDYANIVIAIQKYLGADVLTKNILYDEELELLTTDKPVFFPDTERHQKLPSGVGVQMLNVELFNSIKTEMATTSNPIIIANLKGFNLREFNFREVVEALITHFKPGNTPTANITLLHKHIFGFYQSETSLPSVWQGGLVPILTRKGKTGFAQKVYFGKEYDQFLTESLFHYDNSRLIAPATKFEQVDTAKWREYLAWIGVTILPRKKMIDAEEAFATFTMRNFDYRKPISGRIFDDGRDFRNHLNSYDEIQVQSIDQLEQLLKNNTPENVIAWLHSDDSIFGLMSKNSELKNSYIGFNFAYGKEVKYIDGTVIPNYLRWKISQTAWLTTESNVKERPDKCTTAVSITADFSPLIEKPKIDFDLLRKKGIDRQRAEDILYNCGVHRSVNTFSTAMLYGMLLSLPELDDSGKKARSIYNQLGQNFEERTLDKLDPTEPNYRKFFQGGQVFCNHGGYEQLNQVFYVNDKHLGESLINQFFTIAMDRRRGKEKVLKLFGVPPLENVDITLSKTPEFHQANASFGLDINQFKPYVYALRQLADTGKERTAIKQARFSLVNDLHIKLVKDAVAHNLVFTDYEFLYLADINQVYLRAPANAADLDDLKEDIHFCSAVAEVFSAIIDVDAQRQQIRELYSKSPFGRDLILTAEQDDPQLLKLASARNALDIVIDRKNDFWRAFARCLGRKNFKGNTGNDAALMGELERIFPKFRDYIIPVFSTINYENCNEEDSCAAIVQLLQQTGIKLEDFNQYYFPAISVAVLYTSAFRLEKDSLRDAIKERYYQKCCNVATLRGGFLAALRRFDELVPMIPEIIDFDVTKDIVTAIDQIFGDIPDMDESEIKADAQYYLNKEQLLVLASAQQINKSLTEDFLNDSSAAFSLLFFEPEVPSVAELLQKWASVATGSGGTGVPAGKSKKLQFGGRALFYNDFLDLRQQLDAGLAALQLQKIKLQDIAVSKTEIKKRDSDTNKSFKKGGRLPAKNEESGFLGEYLIYQYLLVTTKAIESVKWVSRYAKDCQLSTEDGTGAGYDLEYVPNGGTYPRYVEVKVIGQEDAFHISSNEVRFGEVNKKYHDIFLVRNAHDPAHLQIERISGLFDYGQGGSFNQNEAFTVVNDNYILKFKKTN